MPQECAIQGYSQVEPEVLAVRTHKKSFVIFEINKLDPVALKIVASGGLDTSVDVRATPAKEDLRRVFEECKQLLKNDKPCFIVYNFGYYNDKNCYREMLLFISFIPEDANLRNKIAMTSNTSVLQGFLNTPMHIGIYELEDFEYENFKKECATIQRK